MSAQALNDIVCNATVLLDRLDRNGYIFDSSSDENINDRIVRNIDANKIDIISMLYNIINLKITEM